MESALDYEGAVAYAAGAKRFGIHPSLDGIRTLTAALGRPHDTFRAIQVAGTNGKTSVARMTAALLTAHGHRTGVFMSPRLSVYTDQIAVDGVDISPDDFARSVSEVRDAALALDDLTEFELVCASALVAFRAAHVRWGVLEVGMGGRWDATSVVTPRVAVITGIGLDHVEHLGGTREAVAREKACIIGEGSTVVLGPGTTGVREVFLRVADDVEVPVINVTEAPTSGEVTFEVTRLPGPPGRSTVLSVRTESTTYTELAVAAPSYQAGNVATAVAAAEAALGGALDAEDLRRVLLKMRFPGRFELVSRDPYVVLDGAHNPQAAEALADAIGEAFDEDPPVVVMGVLDDKDVRGMVAALAPSVIGFVATQSMSERALPAVDLARTIEEVTGSRPPVALSIAEAIDLACGSTESGVVVTGSLTTAGEARGILLGV